MLIYKELDEQEKQLTMPLWRAVFPEDSREFVAAYYRTCTGYNRVLAILDDIDGSPAAMLHMNPYTLSLGAQTFKSYYIVGVATAPQYRRKGLMRKLLREALLIAQDEHLPFVYLTAENQAVYKPFGFVYIGDQYEINTTKAALDSYLNTVNSVKYNGTDIVSGPAMLKTVRDPAFYARYTEQTAADGGQIIFLPGIENAALTYYSENGTDHGSEKIKITDFYNAPRIQDYFTFTQTKPLMLCITDPAAYDKLCSCLPSDAGVASAGKEALFPDMIRPDIQELV